MMESITLEQMSYLADIIGVVAVVGSLLYVGKQLHQTTQQMEVSAATIYAQWSDIVYSRVSTNREFAELWTRGSSEFGNLDEVDKRRCINHELGAITMWSHFYHLYQSNMLPEHFWTSQLWAYKNIGQNQSIREAWKLGKDAFDIPFQEFMGQFLE